MNTLTLRSKIAVRYTTNPADMGYGGRPSDWKHSTPKMCSPRTAIQFAGKLSGEIGVGTYRLISYQHKGREIERSVLEDLVNEAEYDKWMRKV